MTDTEKLITLFRSGTTAELNDAIAELTNRVGQRESERIYDRALKIYDREAEQENGPDPQAATGVLMSDDEAAARVGAWLDGHDSILSKFAVRSLLWQRAELLGECARLTDRNEQLEQVRNESAEWKRRAERAEARLQAVVMCRVWKDDLGRGRVFADDLRHAVDPELYPEPVSVRLDSDAADLALVQARAATDNGNRTPLADVLAEHGMTESDMEVED